MERRKVTHKPCGGGQSDNDARCHLHLLMEWLCLFICVYAFSISNTILSYYAELTQNNLHQKYSSAIIVMNVKMDQLIY